MCDLNMLLCVNHDGHMLARVGRAESRLQLPTKTFLPRPLALKVPQYVRLSESCSVDPATTQHVYQDAKS
jgi:hypothetical protein